MPRNPFDADEAPATNDKPGGDEQETPDEAFVDAAIILPADALARATRSELEAQRDIAMKYPRNISRFLHKAKAMSTVTRYTAESCIYTLERGKGKKAKIISGPSIRLVEICASAYTNLLVGGRPLGNDDKWVDAEGIAWDMENNVRWTRRVRRRITTSEGRTYGDDMIGVTANAAASIAARNAVLHTIPRTYINEILEAARVVAIGNNKPLAVRIEEVFTKLIALGTTEAAVLAALGKEKLILDWIDIEQLIGLGTAVHEGHLELEDAFPPVGGSAPQRPPPGADAADGQRVSAKPQATTPANTPTKPAEPIDLADALRESLKATAPSAPVKPESTPQTTTPVESKQPAAPVRLVPPEPEEVFEPEHDDDKAFMSRLRAASTMTEVDDLGADLALNKRKIGKARYDALFNQWKLAKEAMVRP